MNIREIARIVIDMFADAGGELLATVVSEVISGFFSGF